MIEIDNLQRQIDVLQGALRQTTLDLAKAIESLQTQFKSAGTYNATSITAIGTLLISKGIMTEKEFYDLKAMATAVQDQLLAQAADDRCQTCNGSGEVTESHESYAAETLGCPHCMGSGKRGGQ